MTPQESQSFNSLSPEEAESYHTLEKLDSQLRERNVESNAGDNGWERLNEISAALERDVVKLREKRKEIDEKLEQVEIWQLLVKSKIEGSDPSRKRPKVIKPQKSPKKKRKPE